MKLQLPLIALLALGFAACNESTTTTSTTTDSAMAPASNMVTTTTTTTTTRPAFMPKPEVKYMDLRSKKMITVRVDTVHHHIVNTETNEPVDWFMEPGTTDTIYGRNMQMANGYIRYGSGADWTYDESMSSGNTDNSGGNMSSGNTNMSSGEPTNGDGSMSNSASDVEKMKTNGNETKVKYSDGSKMKANDNEVKVKGADGSKMKSNGKETKIKN